MERKDIKAGMDVVVTDKRYGDRFPGKLKVVTVGKLFVMTDDARWWHPNELGLPTPAKPKKWQTPGVHAITSYRSFRRYKAAGASFAVIPFNSSTRSPEKTPVPVSPRMALRRAQAGLSLVAIITQAVIA